MNPANGSLIVTGASRGIGAAIAKLVARRGIAVGINYSRDQAGAAEVVDAITRDGGRAVAIGADISREEDVLRLFDAAARELGPIAGLVNNAGITGGFARVEALTAETLAEVLAVNVADAILCARKAVRRMSIRCGGSGASISSMLKRRSTDGPYYLSPHRATLVEHRRDRRANGSCGVVLARRGHPDHHDEEGERCGNAAIPRDIRIKN